MCIESACKNGRCKYTNGKSQYFLRSETFKFRTVRLFPCGPWPLFSELLLTSRDLQSPMLVDLCPSAVREGESDSIGGHICIRNSYVRSRDKYENFRVRCY